MIEFLLLRIMKGQLSFRRSGLSLYIEEPSQSKMYDSIEAYETAYQKAYFEGVMVKDEFDQFLFDHDLYTPFDDSELKKLKAANEDLKLQAFQNSSNKKNLSFIKMNLRQNERDQATISSKRTKFHHLTCEGVADLARWGWIVENSTFFSDGSPYDWSLFSVATILSYYENSAISSSEFRSVARSDFWRPVWSLGKKTGRLFEKPSSELTRDQLMLCSYSSMYDNVYESPESPLEAVINDDDCLDGWFIDQKRKSDRRDKERLADDVIKNSKIKNASEIFLMAQNQEEAKEIHSLNSITSENIRLDRMSLVSEKGTASDLDFQDVQMGLSVRRNQESMNIGRKT